MLIAILGVFIAVAGLGFRAIDIQFDAVNARIYDLSALMPGAGNLDRGSSGHDQGGVLGNSKTR